jgi:hypothetical protein
VHSGGHLFAPLALTCFLVALAVVSIGIVTAGFLGRRSGGLAPIALLLLLSAVLSAGTGKVSAQLDFAKDPQLWRPTTVAQLASGYTRSAGQVTVDLTSPTLLAELAAKPAAGNASLGAGKLILRLPAKSTVNVVASVGFGEIDDRSGPTPARSEGAGASRRVTADQLPAQLELTAQVGAGSLIIEREVAP